MDQQSNTIQSLVIKLFQNGPVSNRLTQTYQFLLFPSIHCGRLLRCFGRVNSSQSIAIIEGSEQFSGLLRCTCHLIFTVILVVNLVHSGIVNQILMHSIWIVVLARPFDEQTSILLELVHGEACCCGE